MVFFIPHDSGERMGFGVTILLSITVYLLVISEALPEKSDDKSMLGICFIAEFYMLCAALVLSLLTMNLFKRNTPPPLALVNFYNFFHAKTKLDGQLRGVTVDDERTFESVNGEHATTNFNNTTTSTGLDDRQSRKFTLEHDGGYLHCHNADDNSVEEMILIKGNKKCNKLDADANNNHNNRQCHQAACFSRGHPRTYNEQWRRIAVFLDNFFFVSILIMICIVPMFITSALSRSGLA